MVLGATVQGSSDPAREGAAAPARPTELRPVADDVKRAVAEHYQVSVTELCGRSRSAGFVEARQVAMYLCRDLGMSYPVVGLAFGRDHTTAIHAYDVIRGRLERGDPDLGSRLDRIKARMGTGVAAPGLTRCARCDGRCVDFVREPEGKVCILCVRDNARAAHAETARLVARLAQYQQLLDEHGCTNLVNSESGQALQWLADKLTQLRELRRGERRQRSTARREG